MIKYFCDKCGKEKKSTDLYKFSFRCHLNPNTHINNCYIDSEGNRVSGRDDSVELCASCYNKVVMPAVKKLFEKKE